jgi:hypothetical protein
MRAIQMEADWEPREGYPVTEKEIATRKATMASQVWRSQLGGRRSHCRRRHAVLWRLQRLPHWPTQPMPSFGHGGLFQPRRIR